MEVQARRFVLLFKEQLPGEYERALSVMERYRQRSLSAADATSELRALLASSGEAGSAFDALLGGPRPAAEGADRGQLRGFVERVFPLLQAELPEAVALLRQNRERLAWDEKVFRSEGEFVAEVLASLQALGFEALPAAERLLGRRGADPAPPSRPSKPAPVARPPKVVTPPPEAPVPEMEVVPEAELTGPERLFSDLQMRLSPGELEMFAHLFELFWRNVLSFAEFRELAEELGARAGKEVCVALKTAVDAREGQRLASNPFNIRSNLSEVGGPSNPSNRRTGSELPNDPASNKGGLDIPVGAGGPLNPSYRRVSPELPFEPVKAPLVNKAYTAIATGTENNANPHDSRGFAKYTSEVSLLNTEDQIYEFDSTLSQLRFAVDALSPSMGDRRNQALTKVANSGVLTALFGPLAGELIAGAHVDAKVAEFLESQLRAKLKLLEEAKAGHFVPAWRAAINAHYFKSLDTRSNAIKHFERKQINPRVLINELKGNVAGTRVRVASSFEFLMSKPQREIEVPADLRIGKLYAPIMALEVETGVALADAAAFAKAFVVLKAAANEKDRALAMLERLVEQFLRAESSRSDLAALTSGPGASGATNPSSGTGSLGASNSSGGSGSSGVNNTSEGARSSGTSLLERAVEFERRLYPTKPFFFGSRACVEVNSSKLAELEAKLRDLGGVKARKHEVGQPGSLNDQFDAVLQSNSSDARLAETSVAGRSASESSRLFFGQQNFYLSFRYFLMFFERFEFARKYSIETTGGEELYHLFKQSLLYSLFDVIDCQAFEDLMRLLFDLHAGPFLSLDKLLSAFAKNTADELAPFVLALNAEMFEGKTENLPCEEVLFAKTCFRQSELLSQAHKNTKAGSASHPLTPEAPELLKFELISSLNILLIHRLRSPFVGGPNTVGKFLEQNFAVLAFGATANSSSQTPARRPRPRPETRTKKITHQSIRSIFASKTHRTMATTVDTEDRILSLAPTSKTEIEKRKEQKKKFVQLFRDKLTRSEAPPK